MNMFMGVMRHQCYWNEAQNATLGFPNLTGISCAIEASKKF